MRIALAAAPLLLAAAAPATAPQIVPGYWEITSTATNVDMPGIPSFLANLAKRPSTTKRCITPEQAARGPVQVLNSRPNCTTQDYRVTGDEVALTTVCPEKEGARTTVHLDARIAGPSYAATGTILGTGGKHGDMRIDFNETGRRTGDCPAGKPG